MSYNNIGTGITPMYQIMRSIASNDEDDTKVALLYANHTPEDILLFEELNKLESDKISIWYTVDELGDKSKDWKYSVGYE
jgi:NAD(P)H-flavin reductase